MTDDYYLGLDIGTGSVGWAVTNTHYEVLKSHGKAMWGVRLFDSAETAEVRRVARTSRRRLARRNWRIDLLQGLFSDEIDKVDAGFFHRMKESQYYPEDKRDLDGIVPSLPYALFVDSSYTDKDYHKTYPTIYHLRNYLMETEDTPDVRLVYLALHHLIKHRGHFLFHGNIDAVREFKFVFGQFLESIQNEELQFEILLSNKEINFIESTLKNSDLSRSGKKSVLVKELHADSTCEKAILGLLCGCTVKLSDIFNNTEFDNAEKSKICFSESSYDDNVGIYESILGEYYYIIEQAKAIYDWSILVDILGDYDSISKAKIELYEKHKYDLQYLKKIVKKHLSKEDYKNIFVKTNDKTANYCAYIGMTKVNGKKVSLQGKQCSREDFYSFIKKNVISKIKTEDIIYIQEEIDKENFLPKQVSKDNGVIPYQVHLYELKKILGNLEDRLPVIKENKEKIEQIFKFRIPYYGLDKKVEELTLEEIKALKLSNSDEKIYPWNFEEVVNIEASAEKFIRRMRNKCTYLNYEDVLPKNSLLYSKFVVLNELNNLKLNGEVISVELKQDIFENLFMKKRKVTLKKLLDYLVHRGICDKSVKITGIDGDFKGALTAYHDFKEKLTNVELTYAEKEDIILNITLFGDDKKLLKQRLKKMYTQLNDKQVAELCKLSYNGWGRLSNRFLSGITAPAPESGEVWTIIQAMWESNDNLMQVLSNKYEFLKAIEEENGKDVSKTISYQLIDELYVSPSVKRQIWQTLLIVKEVCKIMETPPIRVFVEMAREKAESKRTESRKQRLIELYKQCKVEEREWISKLENTDESSLRSDKLYLYYTQKGRCMYSGESINIEELWDNKKYDIDHIYPQSKVMDDSLDNRVLVKKKINAEKSDVYPIRADIRSRMKSFWKSLLDCKLISQKKYDRLSRNTEFEPNELAGFIERQIVETRQGTKAVASILKQTLPNSEIVYAKANVVSEFRHTFDLIKVREMNDLHHAKDAYLNIVVGNTYFVKFTKNAAWFVRNNPGRTYNLQKMFISTTVERDGEVAWVSGANGTIKTVKHVMNKNNILVTRRSYEVKGVLFDLQLMKKGKGQVPIKSSDERLSNIDKYGGYNNVTGSYFMLIESDGKRGNKIRTIEYVPLHMTNTISEEPQVFLKILETERKLKNPRIIISKIKKDTMFSVNGYPMWISGRTDNRLIFQNAVQLLLEEKSARILKKIIKFIERRKKDKSIQLVPSDKLESKDLIFLYEQFVDKCSNSIYGSFLEGVGKSLINKKNIFLEMKEEDKCLLLYEILHIFQCNRINGNLKNINETGSAGLLRINKNISNCEKITIINQSPTGLFEQEIDLKRV